ncbi:diacylglycerol kinase family protein [Paraflavisolibacter sp. H34]|uniref:diacylglycerol/lipid kinase family protein n=1 Tax=Huijunlia imazamoxiresistens TaxID=3127457 RepID=UPI00301B200B
MKRAQLLHNPGAGDEEHSKEELMSLLESNGFECRYSSTKKKEWKDIEPGVDLLVVAGGDGTVRKITEELLGRKVMEKILPIALLPLGTANNIAKTLGITGNPEEIIPAWRNGIIKKYDVGRIYDIEDSHFFLESFGYGVFPFLMKEMKKRGKDEIVSPEEKMKTALHLLHEIILSYEPRFCQLEVDGTDHSGKFLLAEIMNTRSIGPNLCLSPLADPGDGELEVVLVPEKHKEKFAAYIESLLYGKDETFTFTTLQAKEVRISWEGNHVHVDDKVVKIEKSAEVKIELKEGLLRFLVPEDSTPLVGR